MAFLITTKAGYEAAQLLEDINEQAQNRTLKTWSLNHFGGLVHTPGNWNEGAYLASKLYDDDINKLVFFFKVEPRKSVGNVYGYLHGRFLEVLIAHFNEQISLVRFKDYRPR